MRGVPALIAHGLSACATVGAFREPGRRLTGDRARRLTEDGEASRVVVCVFGRAREVLQALSSHRCQE